MEKKNLIVPLVGDFGGPKTIRAVGQYLKTHDSTVTAFYLSNVEQYLFNDDKAGDFYENVGMLPVDSRSTFIRSFSGAGGPFRFQSTLSSMTRSPASPKKSGRPWCFGTWKDSRQRKSRKFWGPPRRPCDHRSVWRG